MTTIHATGTGKVHLIAERATITASVSVTSRDRAESIAAATRLHNWVAGRGAQLRESGDATWHAADALRTWSFKTYAEGKSQQTVVEHRTQSEVKIKLSNLALVSELVTEFAEAGLTTDVRWALTEATRRLCERRTRGLAVEEARAIAGDYADALGIRITSVVSISDAPVTSGGGSVSVRSQAAAAQGSGSAEVSTAEITVRSDVAGVFEAA